MVVLFFWLLGLLELKWRRVWALQVHLHILENRPWTNRYTVVEEVLLLTYILSKSDRLTSSI